MKRVCARKLAINSVLAGRFWCSENSSISEFPPKSNPDLLDSEGPLAKEVVPKMDPEMDPKRGTFLDPPDTGNFQESNWNFQEKCVKIRFRKSGKPGLWSS